MEDSPHQPWLTWAQRLVGLASSGLHFTEDAFDRERYEEIGDIAQQMIARIGSVPVADVAALFGPLGQHYATPMIDVRGALFRGDAVLLVREKSDGRWTLPGGYADVGLSAGENVVKEIREEANLQVQTTRLIAVHHKAKHAYDPDPRDFYKFFFLCSENEPDRMPQAGMETQDARFFHRDALPELSTGRIIAADVEMAWRFLSDPAKPCQFD